MTQPVNALVYLNTNSEARGGTALYRHRQTRRESIPLASRGHASFLRKYIEIPGAREDGKTYWCNYQRHWERFHLLEMKFNRLVIFPSEVFHGRARRRAIAR